MMDSNIIHVIQLVVGLKSGVGPPDTKSFDISFRNKKGHTSINTDTLLRSKRELARQI